MATFGYGRKTYIQGFARLCCRLAKYISKYNAKLATNLTGTGGAACLTSLVSCLNTICGYLNTSDR